MSDVSGGDPNRYTPGTAPGNFQAQADKDAYDRRNNNDGAILYHSQPLIIRLRPLQIPPQNPVIVSERS